MPTHAPFSARRYAGRTRSLIDTLTCQHPRAESRFLFAPTPARFSARRYAGCTRSLIYVLTCHNMR